MNGLGRESASEGEVNQAYRVTRLLAENLSQGDHLRVAVELLCEVDHLVGSVLLIAWSCGGQKGGERDHGEGVALVCTSSGEL